MLHQKDFVACKLTEAAAQNFELKTQNAKLWDLAERQKKAFQEAQAEIDEDREESERLIEDLTIENEQLRRILKIRDEFHVPDMSAYLTEQLRKAEQATVNFKSDNDTSLLSNNNSTVINV